MPIVIELGGVTATYTKGHWTTKAPDNEALMKHLDDMMNSADSPGGDDPYPDLTRVKRMIEPLRGKLIDPGTPPKFKSGQVY